VRTDPAVWMRELRASQQRQAELVGRLTPEELRRPSYDRDWTVAQLLSHMGSGAEITRRRLEAALRGAPPLQREDFEKIWDRWNAMAPEQQAAEMLESDRACTEAFERLDDRTREELRAPFIRDEVHDVATMVAFRLNEHALHSWDTAVTFDPAARVAPGSVALLLDNHLIEAPDWMVARMTGGGGAANLAAKLDGRQVLVRTTDPERRIAFDLAGDRRILRVDPDGRPDLVIPSEALLRLCYGRLDPAHTPAGVQVEPPLTLDDLRATFNGY
jgi:uncharacterized protein (TIGR03083 family)